MNPTFYFVLVIVLLYLLIVTLKHLSKLRKRNLTIGNSHLKLKNAENELNIAKNSLFEEVEKSYGKISRDRVEKGTIWVGMQAQLLIIARGRADDTKNTFVKGRLIERYYYGKYYNRLNNVKYSLEVTIDNDEVVGWRDL